MPPSSDASPSRRRSRSASSSPCSSHSSTTRRRWRGCPPQSPPSAPPRAAASPPPAVRAPPLFRRRRGGPRGVYGRVLGGCRRAHRLARRPVACGLASPSAATARRGVAGAGMQLAGHAVLLYLNRGPREAARPAVAPAAIALGAVDMTARTGVGVRRFSAVPTAARAAPKFLLGDGADDLQPRARALAAYKRRWCARCCQWRRTSLFREYVYCSLFALLESTRYSSPPGGAYEVVPHTKLRHTARGVGELGRDASEASGQPRGVGHSSGRRRTGGERRPRWSRTRRLALTYRSTRVPHRRGPADRAPRCAEVLERAPRARVDRADRHHLARWSSSSTSHMWRVAAGEVGGLLLLLARRPRR